MLKLQQFSGCPPQLKGQPPKLFVGREEFNGNPQESARCRSSNGRYARLCRVTRDEIHQFGFRSLDWVLILAQKLQKTAMKVCFPCLCMRRVCLAPRTQPFQVNRNDEGIAIASSSFFLNAHPSWIVCVDKHGRMCSTSFTMLARISSSFCESDVRIPSSGLTEACKGATVSQILICG